MDRPRLLRYVIAPAAAVGGAVGLYFSGVGWMQSLVAPAANREYGLLEHGQLAVLVLAAATCWRAAGEEALPLARRAWYAAAALLALVFLEELDYGLHHWNLARGEVDQDARLSLHNVGPLNELVKRSVDVTFLLWLGLLPWCARRLPARVRPWLASRWSVATLLVGFGWSRVAHALEDRLPHNGALTANVSEFRELTTHWVLALYLGELRRRRKET